MADGSQPDERRVQQRRQFIKRAAVVSGAVWVAPTIISLSPASAATAHSAPPGPPTATRTKTPPEVLANEVDRSPLGAPADALVGLLARTGSDLKLATTLGLAGITSGGALRLWSADAQRTAEAAAAEAEAAEALRAAAYASPENVDAGPLVSEAEVSSVFENLVGAESSVWSGDLTRKIALVTAGDAAAGVTDEPATET